MSKKALIAMSGGVDSSVAAYLMKEKGYDCIGATMKLFTTEDMEISGEHKCCSLDDVEDARSVAASLGMPYYVFNFSDRFREVVIDNFVDCYENGRTPNPCIECNRHLKFETLFNRAKELGQDYVVTGHYAKIEYDEKIGRYLLRRAEDLTKDQSYVLYSLTQDQLAHAIFPLGGMPKSETRAIAEKCGFINANKADSQDICFVQDGKYSNFIEKYKNKKYPEGDFVDMNGNVMGRHQGIIRYTIGQRKGLGIAFSKPLYVVKVDPVENKVVLGDNEDLFTREFDATDLNLISCERIIGEMRVKAKVRYRHKEQWATVTQPEDNLIHVVFDEPQRAITKGQAAVLYDGDIVVGGGTICKV